MSHVIHITKIESTPSPSLSGMKMVSFDSCRLPFGVVFTSINTVGLVDVKMEDSLEDNQKIFTTVVTFQTPDKVPSKKSRLSFRLTSANGSQYLVGSYARPYAIIKETNPIPGKAGDSIMKTVTVTWKSSSPMLYIVG